MRTLFRSLLMALLGALVIVALTRIDTLRAQGQADAPPQDVELAPGDRISADNNVTFPTDI